MALGLALPLLFAFTRTPRVPPPQRVLPGAETAGGVDLSALSEQLRTRLVTIRQLRGVSAPVPPPRNPFTFRFPEQEAPVLLAAPVSTAAAPRVVDAPPSEPALTLIGIAENRAQGGFDRIAVITDGEDGLHLVREGDTLLNWYRVQGIGEADAQLVEVTSAGKRSLSLAR